MGAFRGRADHTYGFAVGAVRAVDILEIASPEAAAWWRQNAPDLIQPKGYLIFHADVCHIVAE